MVIIMNFGLNGHHFVKNANAIFGDNPVIGSDVDECILKINEKLKPYHIQASRMSLKPTNQKHQIPHGQFKNFHPKKADKDKGVTKQSTTQFLYCTRCSHHSSSCKSVEQLRMDDDTFFNNQFRCHVVAAVSHKCLWDSSKLSEDVIVDTGEKDNSDANNSEGRDEKKKKKLTVKPDYVEMTVEAVFPHSSQCHEDILLWRNHFMQQVNGGPGYLLCPFDHNAIIGDMFDEIITELGNIPIQQCTPKFDGVSEYGECLIALLSYFSITAPMQCKSHINRVHHHLFSCNRYTHC